MNFSVVILAGGKSSRMGSDKAKLEVVGQTLLARQIQLAREVGAQEVFISARADADYSALGCPVLPDKFPDAGPLAGIERALAVTTAPLLLVLAVDLPQMTATLLRSVLTRSGGDRGVIPRLSGRIEPLAALYPKAAQSMAEALLRSGRHTVTTFAETCVLSDRAVFFDLSSGSAPHFANWNTPADVVADRAPAG